MYENSGNLRLMVVVTKNDKKNSGQQYRTKFTLPPGCRFEYFYNSAVTDKVQG